MRIVLDSNELIEVPKTTFHKYWQQKRLKQADALIEAFADFMKVDYIISENRHIYRDLKATDFVTLTAQNFINLIEE